MGTNISLQIFLLDDDQFCLTMYSQYLNNLGYENVITFSKGESCLAQLHRQPDVIFMDHGMDFSNGLATLRAIKHFNPDIYVVFISGEDDEANASSSLKYGALDYVIKGKNDLEGIRKVLKKIAEVRELLKESKPHFIKNIFTDY